MSGKCLEVVWSVSMGCLNGNLVRTSEVKSVQVKSGHVKSGQVKSGQVKSG